MSKNIEKLYLSKKAKSELKFGMERIVCNSPMFVNELNMASCASLSFKHN